MKGRGSGILFHLTSLPSPFGIGDMGPWAYKFADFLAETKQRYWQILPLNPTDLEHGNSPYHSASAFAYNPLLISPELLLRDGLLKEDDLQPLTTFPEDHVDYPAVRAYKEALLCRAVEHFKAKTKRQDYEQFCLQNSHWLDDYALFTATKSHFLGRLWSKWPAQLRDRKPSDLLSARKEFQTAIEEEMILQFLCFKQWIDLKKYCNERGIYIIGDMPIYVVYDSVDVWANPELFKLDGDKLPVAVAGVPPDYFSETGQLWGNPVYRWDVLKEKEYDWWVRRIAHNLELFDFLRLDHFRGFVAYWEVPASETTAINGKWVNAPAMDFFDHVSKKLRHLPILAEDLGVITPDVTEVIDRFSFPCMKILLFAFGEDLATNPYAPHNHVKNCAVYTGTHDNNTAKGWFEREATADVKERLSLYIGKEIKKEEVHWELVRLAMMSIADTALIPLQDILGLGQQARLNRPARRDGNWQWRLLSDQLNPAVAKRLLEMTEIYGRARFAEPFSSNPHP